jgi:Gram-negative bacterial TonB protein C-terminal
MLQSGRISLFALVLIPGLICLLLLADQDVAGQAQAGHEDPAWVTSLYDKNVKYEDFACYEEDATVVFDFFIEHPLDRRMSICHNDCPVISCRPVIPIPLVAQKAKITGTIPVHVLIDEEGDVLYARVLGGHPLLHAAARKAACQTRFTLYPHHKRQGVMHLYLDGTTFLGIPYTANMVP